MPFITQGKTNWKLLVIVFILAAVAGCGIWWWQKSIPEPETFSTIPTFSTTSATDNWQTYRNEEYGFEFKYPPIPSGCENCKINESEEGFDVNRTFLSISDIGGLTLSEYVYKEFPKELEEGPEYGTTTDGGQYLKETFVESRKNITVGDQGAIRVDYRFGGTGRFGTATFVIKDDKVIAFEFTAGAFCCISSAGTIYEEEVYEAMLSTFRFLEGLPIEIKNNENFMEWFNGWQVSNPSLTVHDFSKERTDGFSTFSTQEEQKVRSYCLSEHYSEAREFYSPDKTKSVYFPCSLGEPDLEVWLYNRNNDKKMELISSTGPSVGYSVGYDVAFWINNNRFVMLEYFWEADAKISIYIIDWDLINEKRIIYKASGLNGLNPE